MTKACAYILLVGDAFSPEKAERETGLTFQQKNEPGEIGTRGRYKGQPTPFGWAMLKPPEEGDETRQFEWLFNAALPHIETLRRLGATDGKLHITYAYDTQCNLGYEPELMAKLARLGLAFTISCYRDEEAFAE